MQSYKSTLKKLMERVRNDRDVLAVFLFGSVARQQNSPGSDLDICLVLVPRPEAYSTAKLARKRLHYADLNLDIHFFQQLPLYIRSRILKEGKILFVKDEDLLYEVAIRTCREFEDFKPRYQLYLRELERAG